METTPLPDSDQEKLPYATSVLLLSLFSVVGCVFYGIPGILLALAALLLFRKIRKQWRTDPERFQRSYQTARAGNIIAWISLGASLITTLYTLYVFYVLWYVLPQR